MYISEVDLKFCSFFFRLGILLYPVYEGCAPLSLINDNEINCKNKRSGLA